MTVDIDQDLKPTREVRWGYFIGGDADHKPVPPEAFDQEVIFRIVKNQLREFTPGDEIPPVEEDEYVLRRVTAGGTKLYIAAFVCTSFEGNVVEKVWELLVEEVMPVGVTISPPKNPGKPTKVSAGA